jgi:ferritin
LLRLSSSGVNKLISFFAMQVKEKLKQAAMINRFLMDRCFIKLFQG